MTRVRAFGFVSLLTLSLVGRAVFGDVLHMKDGRTIEGKITEDDHKSPEIKVKINGIIQTFKRSDVDSIEKKQTKEDEYDEKAKAVPGNDAEAHYQLGLWCQGEGLPAQAKKEFQLAIKADTNHEKARKALGFEKVDGQWLDAKGVQEHSKAQEDEKMKAEGKVKYKGEWIPAEDVEKLKEGLVKAGDQWVTAEEKAKIDKGLVKVDGVWMTKEEQDNLALGKVQVDGKWVTLEEANDLHSTWEKAWEIKSEHYLLKTDKDYAFAKKASATAEECYDALKKFFGGMEPKTKGKPLQIFIYRSLDEYNQTGAAFAKGEDEANHSSTSGSFYAQGHPETPVVTYYFFDETHNFLWTEDWLWHILPHQYMAQVVPNLTTPALTEGIATYFETFVKFKPDFKRYRKILAGSRFIELKKLLDLETLVNDSKATGFFLGYETIHPTESALLIFYLVNGNKPEYKQKFEEFLKKMQKSSSDVQNFEHIFAPLSKLEKDFKEWVEDPSHDKPAAPAVADPKKSTGGTDKKPEAEGQASKPK